MRWSMRTAWIMTMITTNSKASSWRRAQSPIRTRSPRGLKEVIARHDVLRLKGFIDVPGKPMRLVVQAVGQRIETYFDRPWGPGEARSTRLVVIGLHDIDQKAIGEAIAAAAG
jgi:G3E family GTPase